MVVWTGLNEWYSLPIKNPLPIKIKSKVKYEYYIC